MASRWRGGRCVKECTNRRTTVPRSKRPEDGAPYHSYPVTVKSKRAGRLDLLDPVEIDHDGDSVVSVDATDTAVEYTTQPVIRVGNILGSRIDSSDGLNADGFDEGVHHYFQDQIARDFTITPDVVYEDETDETFRIVYTAKGPMYSIKDEDDAVATTGGQASIQL